MIFDEEKPVAAPGNVAAQRADAGNVDGNGCTIAVAVDVLHRDATVFVEFGVHGTDPGSRRGVCRLYPAKMSQSSNHSDGSVAAHEKVANVVEEDHGCGRGWIFRLAQKSAYDDFRASRFADGARTKAVVAIPEDPKPFHQSAGAEVRTPFDDDTGGLAFGVRVNHVNRRNACADLGRNIFLHWENCRLWRYALRSR